MKVIEERRSIRKYMDKPISGQQVMQVLESARLAPSGSNTQPWRFIIVKSEDMRGKLATAAHNQQWMTTAPVHIVVVADVQCRLEDSGDLVLDEFSSQMELKQIIRDTSVAIDHMLLEAQDMGLGTCWIAWFMQDDIRPHLDIPKDKYVMGIVTLGYANEAPGPRPRKELEDLIRYEKWT